jgi:hypothetical protein
VAAPTTAQIPAAVAAALAALSAAAAVARDTRLMETAATSYCGTCGGSARLELLWGGLLTVVLFGAGWAVARVAIRPAARAVAWCGAAALLGWAVAAAVAFGWVSLR